ncbi:hypothetical protein OXIME_001338 [Oxyplasma meridianum]|uniref:Uncharacterized protein n=1 Tax=Oxyplasma meridianum TaxID=3073602 RepID=A0AAX4NI51_9ARCH
MLVAAFGILLGGVGLFCGLSFILLFIGGYTRLHKEKCENPKSFGNNMNA